MAAVFLFVSLVFYFSGSSSSDVTYLYQTDFDNGTVIINMTGRYFLAENISFNPNSRATGGNSMPRKEQFTYMGGKYDPAGFGIGFFAAISVIASNVEINLNGFNMDQSVEHALQQRFYSHIELASSPFIMNQGPHQFVVNESFV